jgi:RNA polymerase sigma-70 factor (ECF subfamily)
MTISQELSPLDRGAGETVTSRLDPEQLRQARLARREFLVAIEEHRPRLFAYCRRLAANVWDAEDLVQETLTKAFARAAETHVAIDNPAAWLARIATNVYLDQCRRAQPVLMSDLEVPAAESTDPAEVRDALQELVSVLPPQERAVLMLKDVFDYPLADIASMVGTTTGAVKSALHRGRAKLATPEPVRRRPAPDRAVLEAAAAAFSAYDVDALVELFLDDGVMYIVGMVHETGARQMREGSLEHTFALERQVRYSAEVRDFDGEPLVAIFSTPAEGDGPRGLAEVWRCVTEDGRLRLTADYFFCPEVVSEVAEAWDVPTVLHGYRYH